jgi:hypothetical protein
MKSLLFALFVAILLSSCGDQQVKVMYPNGKVEFVKNRIGIDPILNTKVIVEHSIGWDSSYTFMNDEIYGYNKGILPASTHYPNGGSHFDSAVIIQ